MKSIPRAKNESIVINEEIVVTVLAIDGENVTLAIDAPSWVEVREEENVETSDSMPIRPR